MRSADKAARVLGTTTANLAAAMKTENGIGIHTGGGTGIEKDPENIGKGNIGQTLLLVGWFLLLSLDETW